MTESMKNALERMAAKFERQYLNVLQVQQYLEKEEYKLFKLDYALQKFVEDTIQDQQEHDKKSQELLVVNEHIPMLESSLSQAKSDELILNLQTQLKDRKKEQFELEEWMRKNQPYDVKDQEINYEVAKVHYEFRKAVAERLAEWFATGAVGPGTVTFMDKEYTA